MAPAKDEMLMQFGDSLKGLRNLRKQLYSAADCFESSYKTHNHKQIVVEWSRQYVTKALVSTVDHLGCTAHKLNKLLDEKTTQFCATDIQLSLIQHRLSTVEGLTALSHMFKIKAATTHHNKHQADESKANCDVQPETEKRAAARMKQLDPPFLRKEEARKGPHSFSFTTEKGPERRSVSPLRFLSGSVVKRSMSPTPSSLNKGRWAPEPRRAVSAGRRRTKSRESEREREMEEESYTKRSKHLFKALLSLPHSKKHTTLPRNPI